jgi:hypothetical protein
VVVNGRIWTGTDGLFIADQMQYLAWIRDAANHGLASDLFVLHQTPHDYLQPAVEISAGLTALGVAPWLSLILWKPVAVVSSFFALRAYTREELKDRFAYRAALVLALFFGSVGILGDLWLPFWSWGYAFGLMGIAAMLGGLLLFNRARAEGRFSPWPAALGLLAAWLHPWQGETFILLLIGAEAIAWLAARGERPAESVRERPPLRMLALTIVGTALPLLYYLILDRADPIWRAGRQANDVSWGVGSILIALAPLLVMAGIAYFRRPRNYLAAATRAWAVATFVVYGLAEAGLGATPLHSFAGITIPLAVLAVEAARSIPWAIPRSRPIATLVVAIATVPASVVFMVNAYHWMRPQRNDGNFIYHSEQRALSFLARDPTPGAVLAEYYLGAVIPAETGRHTYIGDVLWSVPNYDRRFALTFNLFQWPLTNRDAQRFVRSTGVRFVLEDCHGHAGGLVRKLRPISRAVYQFGCAAVLEIR